MSELTKLIMKKPIIGRLGIAGFIHKIRNLTAVLQARIELLRSGGGGPREVSGVVAFLGRGEGGTKTVVAVILSVTVLLAGVKSLVISLSNTKNYQTCDYFNIVSNL